MPNTLRRKVLMIANEMFPMLFGQGAIPRYEVTGSGLPKDARCVACYRDDRTVSLVFESESFSPVEVGKVMPEIVPVLTRLDPEEGEPARDGR